MLTIEVSPKLNIHTVTAVTGVCEPSETVRTTCVFKPGQDLVKDLS